MFPLVQDLQRPTHPHLYIRDTRDALIVLEAVRRGILHLVERRLNEGERNMFIRSGAVFVWEENDDECGLKRWTDGRYWSQSKARQSFLFYEERAIEGSLMQATGSYQCVDPSYGYPCSTSKPQAISYTGEPAGLIKQRYSAWITDPRAGKRKKWHIAAYFTWNDVGGLPTPVEDPSLCHISVPADIYQTDKPRSRDPMSEDNKRSQSAQEPRSARRQKYYYSSASEMLTESSVSRNYDQRFSEDQRIIQMLNSRHVI